jgi:hypothetical protein
MRDGRAGVVYGGSHIRHRRQKEVNIEEQEHGGQARSSQEADDKKNHSQTIHPPGETAAQTRTEGKACAQTSTDKTGQIGAPKHSQNNDQFGSTKSQQPKTKPPASRQPG